MISLKFDLNLTAAAASPSTWLSCQASCCCVSGVFPRKTIFIVAILAHFCWLCCEKGPKTRGGGLGSEPLPANLHHRWRASQENTTPTIGLVVAWFWARSSKGSSSSSILVIFHLRFPVMLLVCPYLHSALC